MLIRAATVFASFIMFAAPVSAGTVVYVDDDAPPGGDGTSWATAFAFLQDALAVPGPAEIRIAGGTYQPDRDALNPGGTGQRTVSFALANDTALRGGYLGLSAGKGEDPDERSDANETILSGDLAGDDEPGFVNYDENSLHVITGDGVDETAHVDGATISGGNANGSGTSDDGGGVRLETGDSPRFDNCRFRDNTADSHGGALQGGVAFIQGCLFVRNTANRGGAISAAFSQLDDCRFERNSAVNDDQLGAGGAVKLESGCGSCVMSRCIFISNTSGHFGGAVTDQDSSSVVRARDCVFLSNVAGGLGGAISTSNANAVIANSVFSHNFACVGGGIGSVFDFSISNSLFFANAAGTDVGAVVSLGSSAEITNCTVVLNTAGRSVGGLAIAHVRNCIAWGNIVDKAPNQMPNGDDVEYSIVQGGYPGVGNLDVDPLLVPKATGTWTAAAVYDAETDSTTFFDDNASYDPGALFAQSLTPNTIFPQIYAGVHANDTATITAPGDLAAIGFVGGAYEVVIARLMDTSPAIDAADNTAAANDVLDLDGDGDVSEPAPFDVDGSRRFVDDPCTANSGVPDGENARLDIGAFEFQPSCPADFDCNGEVAFADIIDVLSAWGVCPGCVEDLNYDGEVAFADLLLVLEAWGSCN